MGTPQDPSCVWPEDQRGADGCYPMKLFLNATGGCEIRPGVCFSLETNVEAPMKKHKHKEEIKVEPAPEHEPLPDVIPVDTASITAPPEAPVTTSTVGVDAAIQQVKALVPAGADASPGLMIGGAAGLAVVGAAVKFGPSMLKARAERLAEEKAQAHEEKMKQLEIEEKRSEKREEGHESCSVQRAALEARLMGLVAKLEAIEAKMAALPKQEVAFGSIDPDELTERLEKLEKAIKPAKKAKRGKQ